MKKKIISFTLCLIAVLGFIMTPLSAFAAEVTVTDTLIDEITANIPGFSPSDYPSDKDGSPMVIGSTIYDEYTQGMHNEYTGTIYSVYVYNPSAYLLDYAFALVNVTAVNSEYTWSKEFDNEMLFFKDNYSKDHRFYKFSYKINIPEKEHSDWTLTFDLSYISLKLSHSDTLYNIDQTHLSRFTYDSENARYNVETSAVGSVKLDVNLTSYKVGTVEADVTRRYEIFTAYFAIPDQYIDFYEKLYSVRSEYVKKQTMPLVWSDDPDTDVYFITFDGPFGDKYVGSHFLSKNYTFADTLGVKILFANSGINMSVLDVNQGYIGHAWGSEHIIPVVSTEDPSYSFVKDVLAKRGNDDPDATLYAGYEEVLNTKTIDQTFDILNFYDSAEWEDYWLNYGAEMGLLRWAYENVDWLKYIVAGVTNPLLGAISSEELKAVINQYVDFENSSEHIEDSPYLVLLSDNDRTFIEKASDENIASRYLISVDDVPAFKEYVYSNPYTVLYRFDICESYSDELVKVDPSYDGTIEIKDIERVNDYTYYIARRFDFSEFEVINVSFKDENEYFSLCTRSEKKNYAPGFSYDPVDPPVLNNPNFGNKLRVEFDKWLDDASNDIGNWFGNFGAEVARFLGQFGGGFFDGFFDNLLGDWSQYIKPVLIVIGVILLILFFVWVGRSVGDSNFFSVYFQAKGASQRSKELKLRRSEANARREEHRDDVSIRREQNAI